MKNKNILVIKILIYIYLSVISLMSCKNESKENSLLEDGFQKHELVIDGKRVSFILPNCYSDTFRPDNFIIPYWEGYDKMHVFYSMNNDRNFFSILVFKNERFETEEQMDTYVYKFLFEGLVTSIPSIVPFIEKKKNESGQVYYLIMGSCVDSIYSERNLEMNEQRLIYSKFDYILCSNFKHYVCALRTFDKIKDFSYDEQRKIIESIKIEEIK